MTMKKNGKRFFSLLALALLLALSMGTMIFADDESGSYRLIIKKIINQNGMTPEALAAAREQEYTFRIQGVSGANGDYDPFSREVTVKGDEECEVYFSVPVAISLVELTDNSKANVPGYQMSNSSFRSTMRIPEQYSGSSRETRLSVSKPGGQIAVQKPAAKEDEPQRTYTYRIYPYYAAGAAAQAGQTAGWNHIFTIANGETYTVDNVPAGEYIIEEVRAREGFDLLARHSAVNYTPGEEAEIRLRGSAGLLRLTPPADGKAHTYTLTGSEGSYTETFDPGAGAQTLMRDNLAAGEYSVCEEIYEGFSGFEVSSPGTADEYIINSSLLNKNLVVPIPDGVNRVGDGVKVGFRNAKGQNAGTTFKVKLTGLWQGDASEKTKIFNFPVKSDPSIVRIKPPYLVSDKLQFNISSENGLTGVTLRLDYPDTAMVTESTDGSSLTQQAGNLGQLIISKPEDKSGDVSAGEVQYKYTVTGNGSNAGYKTEFTLRAGESETIDGLTWGYTYNIKETIIPPEPAGYTLEIIDDISVSTIGGSLTTTIINETGTLTVEKEARYPGTPHMDGRTYYYTLKKPGGATEEFELKAGQSKTFGPNLAPGEYQVDSVKDTNLGFTVSYGDSSTLRVLGSQDYVVEVTNSFTEAEGGYHVVHEYYPSRDLVGAADEMKERSEISSIGGKPLDNQPHTADEVDKILRGPNTGLRYVYDSAVYGNTSGGRAAEPALASQRAGETYAIGRDAYDVGADAFDLTRQSVENNPYIVGSDANRKKRAAAGELAAAGLTYAYDESLNYVVAKPQSEDQQIIILRYYLAEDEETQHNPGSYKVVHAYFLRTPNGDLREGFSEIITKDKLPMDGTWYYFENEAKRPEHRWQGQDYTYTFFGGAYGKIVNPSEIDKIIEANKENGLVYEAALRYGYQPDSTMDHVVPTVKGDQVIILRYYRTAADVGSYKYVHEYYLRTSGGDVFEGRSNIGSVEQLPLGDNRYTAGNVSKRPAFDGRVYTYDGAAYGQMTGDGGYEALADREWVTATHEGQQVIILRYYRGSEPEPPPGPGGNTPDPEKPDDPGGSTDEPDPPKPVDPQPPAPVDPPPTVPVEPQPPTPVEPVKPEIREPKYPLELPDPNDPDSPDEITILENGVPTTYLRVWDEELEEWVYLPDSEVALASAEAPETGDSAGLWLWAALAAGALAALAAVGRNKPKNNQ